MSSMKDHKVAIMKLKKAFWARCFSISDQQEAAQKDPGASGPIWVARTSFTPPPQQDATKALLRVVDELKQDQGVYGCPSMQQLPVEWTGRRRGVSFKDPEPEISEKAKYENLSSEASDRAPTVMYIHGGGFYLGSPTMARAATTTLASLSNGRCVAVGYRYSTTEPFPGALLDVFQAYLSLLSPPPGSFHTAIPSENIVFAGESSGLNLVLSLIQVLLRLRENTKSIMFHGREVALELPAGVAGLSGWLDLTGALPSWKNKSEFDYLPVELPCYTTQWPGDPLWPADPPRGDLYCETSALAHPLVCPIAAQSWRGAPPMWLACGEERCADGVKLVAQQAARDDVTVILEVFEAMPHAWTIYLPKTPHGKKAYEEWGRACKQMTSGPRLTTKAVTVSFEDLTSREIDPKHVINISQGDAMRMIVQERDRRPTIFRSQLGLTNKSVL